MEMMRDSEWTELGGVGPGFICAEVFVLNNLPRRGFTQATPSRNVFLTPIDFQLHFIPPPPVLTLSLSLSL